MCKLIPTNSPSTPLTARPSNVKRAKAKNTRKKTNTNLSQTTKTVARRKQWKEYSRRYRDKINSDSALSLKQQEKDHERYLSRRKCMKIKLISQMTEREKRNMRRRWRVNTQNARLRKTDNIETTPTATNQRVFERVESNSIAEHSYYLQRNTSKQMSGRKKVRRDRASAYLKLAKLQTELKDAQRRVNRYKKRLQRIKGGVSNASPSPAKKVRQLLKRRIIPCDIRKKLLYSACLDKTAETKLNRSTQAHAEATVCEICFGLHNEKVQDVVSCKGRTQYFLVPVKACHYGFKHPAPTTRRN
jgi:hypothetical protein